MKRHHTEQYHQDLILRLKLAGNLKEQAMTQLKNTMLAFQHLESHLNYQAGKHRLTLGEKHELAGAERIKNETDGTLYPERTKYPV